MTNHAVRLRDSLGAADSYLHTMGRVVESIFNLKGNDYCALMLIIENAKKEVNRAHEIVDDMEGAQS